MPVRSIFHVGFVVSDLDSSLRFYCDGLGLVLRHRQLQHNAYTSSLVGYPDAVLEIAQLRFADVEPPPSGHVNLAHHRAQLGVYLRLQDKHLPGMYGPSADEM